MKRQDMKVGQDYLIDPSPNWETRGYRADRYRILSTDQWNTPFRRLADDETVATMCGVTVTLHAVRGSGGRYSSAGVLAVAVDKDSGKPLTPKGHARPVAVVVRSQEVRATWDEGVAAIKATRERKEADERAARDKKAIAAARCDGQRARLAALLGGPLPEVALRRDWGGSTIIAPDTLDALLALAEGNA